MNDNNFEDYVEPSKDTDESNSSNSRGHSIIYHKWMKINEKASKFMVLLPFSDVLETVEEKINKLKHRLFVRNEQYKNYNDMKLQMPENTIVLQVDYAENYENKQQGERQTVCFKHTYLSTFTRDS